MTLVQPPKAPPAVVGPGPGAERGPVGGRAVIGGVVVVGEVERRGGADRGQSPAGVLGGGGRAGGAQRGACRGHGPAAAVQ